jgi:hypothetical protein
MNIKKIIQEEVNDFDWVRDIKPTKLQVGDTLDLTGHYFWITRDGFLDGQRLLRFYKNNRMSGVVTEINTTERWYRITNITTERPLSFEAKPWSEVYLSIYEVDDNISINESNDFDWVQDIQPSYTVQDIIDNYNSLQDLTFTTEGTYFIVDKQGIEREKIKDFNHKYVSLINLNRNYGKGSLLTVKILDKSFNGTDGMASGEQPIDGCDGDCWNLMGYNVSIIFKPLAW